MQYSLDHSICGEIVDCIHLIHIQTDSHTYTPARKLHGTILIPISAVDSASPRSPPSTLVPSFHLEVDLEPVLACDWQLWRSRWHSSKCSASSEFWRHQRLRWLSVQCHVLHTKSILFIKTFVLYIHTLKCMRICCHRSRCILHAIDILMYVSCLLILQIGSKLGWTWVISFTRTTFPWLKLGSTSLANCSYIQAWDWMMRSKSCFNS